MNTNVDTGTIILAVHIKDEDILQSFNRRSSVYTPIARALYRLFPGVKDTPIEITIATNIDPNSNSNIGVARVEEILTKRQCRTWQAKLPSRITRVHETFVALNRLETARDYWKHFPSTSNERMFTLQFMKRRYTR